MECVVVRHIFLIFVGLGSEPNQQRCGGISQKGKRCEMADGVEKVEVETKAEEAEEVAAALLSLVPTIQSTQGIPDTTGLLPTPPLSLKVPLFQHKTRKEEGDEGDERGEGGEEGDEGNMREKGESMRGERQRQGK